MASSDELAAFIASSFRSVWALELLLLLKHEGRSCSHEELVSGLRASPSVVEKAMESLIAAGLAGADEEESYRYMPVGSDVALLVEETEQLYRSRPDRVRRLIVASSNKGLAAFSDAFRLKD
jgi:DNA-binding IclR family transcriptional regulator